MSTCTQRTLRAWYICRSLRKLCNKGKSIDNFRVVMYICLDIGDKRVGIAYSVESLALAKEIIPRVELISYLKKNFFENSVNQLKWIVVGLPYDLYGKDTHQLEKTQKLIHKLEQYFQQTPIIGYDERFSSFIADEWHKDHRDDIDAQCILQSYLDSL